MQPFWIKWNKQAYRFLFELIVIICGISISFWLNERRQDTEKYDRETQLLKDILSEIEQIEVYNESRQQIYQTDNYWMDYISENWDSLDVKFVAKELGKHGFAASFHNLFFDFREFHPPMSILTSLRPEESAHTITVPEIKQQISALNTSIGFVKKNVDSEIDLQLRFREQVMFDSSMIMSNAIDTAVEGFWKQFNQDTYDKEKAEQQLRIIKTKRYARNYLNLKIRQRAFIMAFIRNYREDLVQLKEQIRQELRRRQ
jgi:hypothetical protein